MNTLSTKSDHSWDFLWIVFLWVQIYKHAGDRMQLCEIFLLCVFLQDVNNFVDKNISPCKPGLQKNWYHLKSIVCFRKIIWKVLYVSEKSISFEKYCMFQKNRYHLKSIVCFRKMDIIRKVLYVSEKSISFEKYYMFQKNWYHLKKYYMFQKNWYHLKSTICFRKFDIIWKVLYVSEKLISFEKYCMFQKNRYHFVI